MPLAATLSRVLRKCLKQLSGECAKSKLIIGVRRSLLPCWMRLTATTGGEQARRWRRFPPRPVAAVDADVDVKHAAAALV